MKTKANYRHGFGLAFLDMVFNMTLAFAFLFTLAFVLIRPPANPEKRNVDLKAEFILTMTWPAETLDDIDMWIMMPDGRKVMYMNKDVDYVTLDRDDRGGYGDTYGPFGGPKQLIKHNREMITIRAIVPGRYVVAAHVFAVYSYVDEIKTELHLPYEAKLELAKINPRVVDVASASVLLDTPRQQKAFLAFTVEPDGSVSNIERNPPDEIVVFSETSGPTQ